MSRQTLVVRQVHPERDRSWFDRLTMSGESKGSPRAVMYRSVERSTLVVKRRALLQRAVRLEVVLDPELSAALLQEGVERRSGSSRLIGVHVECWDAVEH